MQVYSSSISLLASQPGAANVVPVGSTLEQVVERVNLDGPGFVLVAHEDGALAGIISTEELLLRISAADGVERMKWSSRPIESILSAVFAAGSDGPEGPAGASGTAKSAWRCTAFVHGARLQAVATEDDVLLSWKSLEPFLAGAARDAVTGLITRTSFLRSFECELVRARRSQKPLSVLLIDVDHFKQINDLAGHAAGDVVLNLIAGAICTSVRSYDLVARFAGDEFVALCCECDPDQAQIPVNRIQDAIAALPLPESFPVAKLTLSIGVASVPAVTAGMTCEMMLETADECLYTAKRHGRDRAYVRQVGPGVNTESSLVPRLPHTRDDGTHPYFALPGWQPLICAERRGRTAEPQPLDPVELPRR